jgi:hypothetical protein
MPKPSIDVRGRVAVMARGRLRNAKTMALLEASPDIDWNSCSRRCWCVRQSVFVTPLVNLVLALANVPPELLAPPHPLPVDLVHDCSPPRAHRRPLKRRGPGFAGPSRPWNEIAGIQETLALGSSRMCKSVRLAGKIWRIHA